MTPQEIAMNKAQELYYKNQRWRMIIDSTTYAAVESTKATHSPVALAREAAMLMLGRIYCEGGALETLDQIAKHQEGLLLRKALLEPSTIAIAIPGADVDFLPALRSAEAWLERWARHVGNCQGGDQCTCGLTAIRSEAAIAIQNHDHPEQEKQP